MVGSRHEPAYQDSHTGPDRVQKVQRCTVLQLLIRHELFMNPFGLSLSKPFDRLKANGFSDSAINRA